MSEHRIRHPLHPELLQQPLFSFLPFADVIGVDIEVFVVFAASLMDTVLAFTRDIVELIEVSFRFMDPDDVFVK
jgi:hypothetical protein